MKPYIRLTLMMVVVSAACFCLFACGEKKQGKVMVTEKEFETEKDGKYTLSLNVKGKIKNVGDVDVKNVVITGECRKCDERMISGEWFVTLAEKVPEQKDTVAYLPAGAEVGFQFKDIAFYYTKSGESPQANPEGLEVVIESFETVQ